MSSQTALDIANTANFTLQDKIDFHLALSFERPVRPDLAPILCELVRLVDRREPMDHLVTLPPGMTYKGSTSIVAWDLFCAFKLAYFVQFNRDTLPS